MVEYIASFFMLLIRALSVRPLYCSLELVFPGMLVDYHTFAVCNHGMRSRELSICTKCSTTLTGKRISLCPFRRTVVPAQFQYDPQLPSRLTHFKVMETHRRAFDKHAPAVPSPRQTADPLFAYPR